MEKAKKKKLIISMAIILSIVVIICSVIAIYCSIPSDIKTLRWIKNKINKYYYYPLTENFDSFVQQHRGANGEYSSVYTAINSQLLDKYSRFYTQEEYSRQQQIDEGTGVGIGMAFLSGTNQLARIPIGSPLYFANIKAEKVEAGMYLTKIGSSPIQNYQDIQMAMQNYTPQDSISCTFQASLTAQNVPTVTLSVQPKQYTESYLLYTCKNRAFAYLYHTNRWEEVTQYTPKSQLLTDDNIAYIKLSSFMGESHQEFAYAMEQLQQDNAKTVLLDLRNNGGGYLSHMASIANYLLRDTSHSKNVVLTARNKYGRTTEAYTTKNLFAEYFANRQLKVMANGNSASASEALMGALLSYGTIQYKDIFIPRYQEEARTYGKGIMQSTYVHPFAKYAIKLTTAQIYWPNGVTIHGRGIEAGTGSMQATCSGVFLPVMYGDKELATVVEQVQKN